MSNPRVLSRITILLVCALLGVSVGAIIQIIRLSNRGPEFRSLAKIVAGDYASRDNITYQENLKPLYRAIIETLESPEMKRRALERVRAQQPELNEADVEIRVAQDMDNAMLYALATASEPKYARTYLDALLDEFISARMNQQEQAFTQRHQPLITELDDWQHQVEVAEKEVAKIRSEVADPKTPTPPGWLSRLNEEKEVQYRAEAARSRASAKVEQARQAFKAESDYITVQERATMASEDIEDWTLPIAVGVIVGGMVGSVTGMLMGFVFVRLTPPLLPPTA